MITVYDPEKKTLKRGDKIINFYCGPELTKDAMAILDLYFGLVTPQQALIERMFEKNDLMERMFKNG